MRRNTAARKHGKRAAELRRLQVERPGEARAEKARLLATWSRELAAHVASAGAESGCGVGVQSVRAAEALMAVAGRYGLEKDLRLIHTSLVANCLGGPRFRTGTSVMRGRTR